MEKRIICVIACGCYGGMFVIAARLGWHWWAVMNVFGFLVFGALSFLFKRQERIIDELTRGVWELKEVK